jgi:hypothetical protein
MISSAEQTAVINCKLRDSGRGGANRPVVVTCTSGIAITARRNINPVPGQPSGNVEKSLCTKGSAFRLIPIRESRYPEKRNWATPLSRCLKADDSALQPYGYGVCSVIGAEFGKNIFDMTFHGLFRDGELGGDLFVGVAA